MNGDELRDVRTGDPVSANARRHNEVNRVIADFRARHVRGNTAAQDVDGDAFDVPILNSTSNAISRYGILGLDSPLNLPADSLKGFKSIDGFKGVAPVASNHLGRFAITQEPIGPNAIGIGRIAGISRVQLGIGDATDTSADVMASSDQLITSATGSARIIWKESGTGVKWGYVHIGGGATFKHGSIQYQVPQMVTNNAYAWQGFKAGVPFT